MAESGDPFAEIRVIDLLARIERGRPVLVRDVAIALQARYLDWLFPEQVVVDVALRLQANWMSDYRNASGIRLDDGPYGVSLTIEDSTRVDPWIVGQAQRAAAACRDALREFSLRERPGSDD